MDEVEVVLAEDVSVVEEAQVLLLDHPLDRRGHPDESLFNSAWILSYVLGHKINCTVRFKNSFFRVPLMYQPCYLVPC